MLRFAVPVPIAYDDRDTAYESELENIRKLAEDNFETMMLEAQAVEGKYKARIVEAGGMLLGHALGAVKEKANVKG